MPRMMPLRIDRPDLSNILTRSEGIKSQRLNNAVNTRNLEREPERYKMEQAQGQQNLAAGKHNLKAGTAKYNLEKLQMAGRLFGGVTNQKDYEEAVSTFVRTFPDEVGSLKTMPREYSPKFVEQVVKISITAAEKVAAMNLEGRKITAAGKETPAQKQERELGTYEGKKKIDKRYPTTKAETPETKLKGRKANLYLQWADGRPLDTFSDPEKKIIEQEIAAGEPTNRKETLKEKNYKEWKTKNTDKSIMDFEVELKSKTTKEPGALSDNAVYERLQDYSFTIDPEAYPVFTEEYEKLRKTGKNRNDAYNEVVNGYKAAVSEMPPAEAHKDKVIRDNTTGKRYKSDGTNWLPLR